MSHAVDEHYIICVLYLLDEIKNIKNQKRLVVTFLFKNCFLLNSVRHLPLRSSPDLICITI